MNSIPILMYHDVSWNQSLISISPDVFRQQIEWLDAKGYQAVPLSQFLQYHYHGTKLPEKTIVLTFDDGFAGLYDHVYPVLVRHNFSATIFLVSDYVGGKNDWPGQPSNIAIMPLLDWDQIREMDKNQIEFGCHTKTHPFLDTLPPEKIKDEIIGSKAHIESELKHKISTFAYPYGRYNESTLEIVNQEFNGACSTQSGFANRDQDPFELNRIDVNFVSQISVFKSLGAKPFPIYVALRGALRKLTSMAFNRQYR